nr:hypothetical protein [Tanacetum cinerariifolium]
MVKKLENRNKLKVLKLKRLKRVGTAQKDVAAVSKDVKMLRLKKVQMFKGGNQNHKQKSIRLTLNMLTSAARRRKGVVIRDPEESTTPTTIIHSEAKSKDKGKGILVEEPKPLKKQAQIKQDEAYARELEAKLNKNIDWDEIIDHVQRNQKEDNDVKRYQALKRKPQTEA